MFGRLQSLVNQAVDVVAPVAKSRLDAFKDHWRYVRNVYEGKGGVVRSK